MKEKATHGKNHSQSTDQLLRLKLQKQAVNCPGIDSQMRQWRNGTKIFSKLVESLHILSSCQNLHTLYKDWTLLHSFKTWLGVTKIFSLMHATFLLLESLQVGFSCAFTVVQVFWKKSAGNGAFCVLYVSPWRTADISNSKLNFITLWGRLNYF